MVKGRNQSQSCCVAHDGCGCCGEPRVRVGTWMCSIVCSLCFQCGIFHQMQLLSKCTVCKCVCVMSPRWWRRSHEVAGEDSYFRGIHPEVAHFSLIKRAVHVQGTHRANNTVPHRQQVLLLSWVWPQYHQPPSNAFALLDLHSSIPPYHHTPRGHSSWQSDQSTLTASSGYGDRSTWCASTACFTPMAPSCHSLQGLRRGPGQPILMPTVSWPTNQDPDYCLGPALHPYG